MKEEKQKASPTLAELLRSREVEDWVTRPVARAAKTTAKGFASLADLANLPVNAVRGFAGYEPLQSPSEMVGGAFDEYTNGLTRPQNTFERVADTAGEFITSGGPFALAGKAAPALSKLAPQTFKELAGTASSGAAFEVGREVAPDSFVIPLLASMAPGLAYTALFPRNSLASGLGVNPNKMESFEKAGLNPTLADISDSKFVKGLQNTLLHTPFAEEVVQDAIQSNINKINSLGTEVSKAGVGTLGRTGAKTYKAKSDEFTSKLKNKWVNDITPSDKVQMNNINNVISTKSQLTEPETIKRFNNSAVGGFYNDLDNISKRNNGQISMDDLLSIRDAISDKITTFMAVGDKSQGQLKALRKAIGGDLRSLAYEKGEEVGRNYDRYNKYYTLYRDKIDNHINPLLKDESAIKAYNKIKNDLNIDAGTAKLILRTMKPEEKEVFSGALIRTLGKNTQNEFNGTTLATNFKKLQPEARKIVLSGLPEEAQHQFKATIDAIDNLKSTTAQGNPSGTYTNAYKASVLGAFFFDPLKTSVGVGSAYVGAQLITSPKFLKWLSKADSIQNETQAAKHINGLTTIAKGNPELTPQINQYLKSLSREEDSLSTQEGITMSNSDSLESLSDQELLRGFAKSDEIKNLTDDQLEEFSNLWESMHPAQP